MIVNDKVKSYSLYTSDENEEELRQLLELMTPEELALFELASQEREFEDALFGLELEREIVPTKDWLEDPFYAGEVARNLYAPWKQDLIELCDSGAYHVALVTGGIGSGKSYFSHLAVLRMLYEASCLKDPVKSYGLARGSMIGFCNLAKSKETARRAVFEGIVSKMKEMPYFRLEFPPISDTKSELIFPKGLALIAGSSTDTSIIGLNIAGGVIDEGNFFQKSGGTVVAALNSGEERWGAYARIGRLYDSVLRRIQSRFAKRGRLPGFLLVASSKTTQDSFTERIIRQAVADDNTKLFVRDRAIIDVKRQYFSKETFRVLVGTEAYPSRILEANEDVAHLGAEAIVIEVPEDLRAEFQANLEEALRDLAGVSTIAIASFMGRVDVVDAMKDPDRQHPFVCPLFSNPNEWDSRLPYTMNWQRLARQKDNGEWEPLRHPHAKRWVHFDPASTGDAFGFCMAHVAALKPVARDEEDGSGGYERITEYQPVFEVDFILRIKGEPGSEVQFKNVRKLMYKFSEHGFHIAGVTTDSYQSREMIQALTDQGYKADLVSMDTSKEPYRMLRQSIYDGRVKCYDYPVLFRELKGLEDTPLKIDHAINGSKDCADALCGAVWGLFNSNYAEEPLGIVKGVSEGPEDETMVNESFMPIKTAENDPRAIIDHPDSVVRSSQPGENTVKVYKKDRPKVLAPAYKKVGADGKVQDLTHQELNPEDAFVRG